MRILLKSALFFFFSLYVEIYKICFDKCICYFFEKENKISSKRLVAFSEKYYLLMQKFKANEERLLNEFSAYKKIIDAEVE